MFWTHLALETTLCDLVSMQMRRRGGGLPDPGTSSHDFTVDCEMFLSEFEDVGIGDGKRPVMAKACLLYSGRLEDGQLATAAATVGDGACSLHSLWGSVIYTPAGSTYYCADARDKLCEAMPTNVNDISKSCCGAALRVLFENIWSDVIAYVMRKTRQEPFMPGLSFRF